MALPIQLKTSPHHLQELQDQHADEVDDENDTQPSPSQEAMLQCMTRHSQSNP